MLKTQECTEPFHGNGRDTQRTQVFVSHYTLKIVWILLQLIILPCSCPVLGMSSTNINPFFSHLSCAWHSFLDDDVKVLFNYFTYLWAPCNLVGVLELAERMQVGIYKFSIHSKSFFMAKYSCNCWATTFSIIFHKKVTFISVRKLAMSAVFNASFLRTRATMVWCCDFGSQPWWSDTLTMHVTNGNNKSTKSCSRNFINGSREHDLISKFIIVRLLGQYTVMLQNL